VTILATSIRTTEKNHGSDRPAAFAAPYVGNVYTGSLILMLVACSTAFILVVTSFLDAAPRTETPP
jgi:hypothetical protein